jgi:hypothetical protein
LPLPFLRFAVLRFAIFAFAFLPIIGMMIFFWRCEGVAKAVPFALRELCFFDDENFNLKIY